MENTFTANIKKVLEKHFGENSNEVYEKSLLIQYINTALFIKNKNMETITKQQAIEQTYTHCASETGEYLTKLTELNEVDFPIEYFVCEKEPLHPSIDNEQIAELISEAIYNGEEFYDEHDMIGEKTKEIIDKLNVDNILNEALSTLNYYKPTNIRLIG